MGLSVTEQEIKPVCGPACLCAFTPQGYKKTDILNYTVKQVNCSNGNVVLCVCALI